jgi:hypothetical protein
MIRDLRRWSPSFRWPKVYRQMERSGHNSRRVGMVLTETPPADSVDTRCAKAGTRTPFGRCGDDGGRVMNPTGSSRIRLSSSPHGRGRFPGPLITQEALGRPGVSLSCHCTTSLAIRRS